MQKGSMAPLTPTINSIKQGSMVPLTPTSIFETDIKVYKRIYGAPYTNDK